MNFLDRLAAEILERDTGNLDNLVVVLPNVRARLYLNRIIAGKAGRAIFLPIHYSSSELMEKISGLRLADDFQLLAMLMKSYPAMEGEELSFSRFLNWGETVLNDFRDADHQLADMDNLFRGLNDIRHIESWDPGGKALSPFQEKYLGFCSKLPVMYSEFTRRMMESSLAHAGFIQRVAAEKAGIPFLEKDSRLVVAGFNAMTRAEEEVFGKIKENYKTEFYYDFDKYYTDNNVHEAGHFARKLSKVKGLKWISAEFEETVKDVSIWKSTSAYAQALTLNEILSKLPEGCDLTSVVVILPDEKRLIPVLQCLPPNITEVNITMGYALILSPYHDFFESMFRMYEHALIRKEGLYFRQEDVIMFADSEGVKTIAGHGHQEIMLGFREKILSNRQVYISFDEFSELAISLLSHDLFNGSKEVLPDLPGILKRLCIALDKALSERKNHHDKISREFLLRHFEVLVQTERMAEGLLERADAQTQHSIFLNYSKMARVQFSGTPLAGIQIMGLLESRNIDFKHVIILDNIEGVLPPQGRRSSLLPNELKSSHGIALQRERDAVVAYHYYRLLQRASDIHLLYHEGGGGFNPGEISRYLLQLQNELSKANAKHRITLHAPGIEMRFDNHHSTEIAKTENVIALLEERISRKISASAFIHLIQCPRDFFLRHVLNLRESETAVDTLESNEIGTAIHNCLYDLYKPHLNSIMDGKKILEMQKVCNDVLKNKFLESTAEVSLLSGKNYLALEMSKRMLLRFLEKEADFVRHNKVELLFLEQKLERTFIYTSGKKKINVTIRGKADRIERVNGILRIVDYKTGRVEDKDLKSVNFDDLASLSEKSLQLLIYLWMMAGEKEFSDQALSASVGSIKSYATAYFDLKNGDNLMISPDQMKALGEQLQSAISHILNRSIPLQHNPEIKYCLLC